MVLAQLSPYEEKMGRMCIKLWDSIWIFAVIKIAFQVYYIATQVLADQCCDGVFKRHQVVVKLLEDVTDV